MKYILLALLTGCGIDLSGTQTVTGEVTVTYKIDLMTKYFEVYCKDLFPDSEQLQTECVSKEVVKFIKLIEGEK